MDLSVIIVGIISALGSVLVAVINNHNTKDIKKENKDLFKENDILMIHTMRLSLMNSARLIFSDEDATDADTRNWFEAYDEYDSLCKKCEYKNHQMQNLYVKMQELDKSFLDRRVKED